MGAGFVRVKVWFFLCHIRGLRFEKKAAKWGASIPRRKFMYKITMFVGAVLSVLGLVSYSITAFEHWTAAFPLIIGLPIAYCGWVSEKHPEKRKLYMHIALGLALFLFIGSAVRLPSIGVHPDQKVMNKAISLWLSSFLTFLLLGIYVQSFLKIRMERAKKSSENI